MTQAILDDLVLQAHQVKMDRMALAFRAILAQWDRKEFRDRLVQQVWERLDPEDPEDYEDLRELLGRLGRLDQLDRLVPQDLRDRPDPPDPSAR